MTFDVQFQEVSEDFGALFKDVVNHPCSVIYTEQSLTEEQKAQARENIDACRVDDTAVGDDVWSSKNTVDKLCPSFTESGAVVICEPVEGYPLSVVTSADGSSVDALADGAWKNGGNWKVVEDEMGGYTAIYYFPLTPGNITVNYMTNDMWDAALCEVDGDGNLREWVCGIYGYENGALYTYEGYFADKYGSGMAAIRFDSYSEPWHATPVLEVWHTPKAATTITRCGKNLCSLGTQTFDVYKAFTNGVILPAGNYHFSAKVETTDTYSTSLLVSFFSMDRSRQLASKYPVHTSGTINFAFTLSEPTNRIYLYASSSAQSAANDTATYSDIQIVPGSAKSAFEPFSGGTFNPGDTIPALPGVNTIYADVGEVTVTGRADPNAIINKLTNAIIALGGNI